MLKIEYIIGAGLVLLWLKGSKQQAQSTQLSDTIPKEGGDWADMGNMWTRLSGAGLSAPGYKNLAAGPLADPGKIGALNAGIMPGWNGEIIGSFQ